MRVNAQSLSCVLFFGTPWTITHQAPLSMEFSRQEYLSVLPSPITGDLPDPGIEIESLVSSTFLDGFFTTGATWEAPIDYVWIWVIISDKRTILV